MNEMTSADLSLLALADTTERFETLVDQTGKNSEAFQAECRELGDLIESLKKTSIFEK